MSSRRWAWAGATVVGGLLAAIFLGARGTLGTSLTSSSLQAEGDSDLRARGGRPLEPPVQGRDEPFSLPEPEPPPGLADSRADAYAAARAKGEARPGEAALREVVRLFIEHNRQFADVQAQAEGLSVEEVEELTFFGMMAQQTQRWPDVEDVLENPVDAATRAAAEALLHDANAAFKAEMRRMVQSGATEAERWALIRQTQSDYRKRYFGLTGMTEAQLQTLLAGDPTRAYPGGTLPPPEVIAERQEEIAAEPPPRPPEAPPEEEQPPPPPPEERSPPPPPPPPEGEREGGEDEADR